ncbi:MAG: LamG domain-containing protein [Candidatus Micrarchaeia archaeon]
MAFVRVWNPLAIVVLFSVFSLFFSPAAHAADFTYFVKSGSTSVFDQLNGTASNLSFNSTGGFFSLSGSNTAGSYSSNVFDAGANSSWQGLSAYYGYLNYYPIGSKPGDSLTSIAGLWHLDSPDGYLYDSSGNGNTLYLKNTTVIEEFDGTRSGWTDDCGGSPVTAYATDKDGAASKALQIYSSGGDGTACTLKNLPYALSVGDEITFWGKGYVVAQIYDNGRKSTISEAMTGETANDYTAWALLNNNSPYANWTLFKLTVISATSSPKIYFYNGAPGIGSSYAGYYDRLYYSSDGYNAASKFNKSFDFNGYSDYLNASPSSSLAITGPFTVGAWIRTNALSGAYGIIHKCRSGCSTSGYSFGNWDLRLVGSGIAFGGYYSPGVHPDNFFYIASPSGVVKQNTWQFVAGVYNGSHVIVYVDGVARANASIGSQTIMSTSENLLVGVGKLNDNSWFNGSIDEAFVYNRALSASEIASMYQRTSGAVNFSARSCPDQSCSGVSWSSPSSALAQNLSLAANRYFQYKADFASSAPAYGPSLYNVSVSYYPYLFDGSSTDLSAVPDISNVTNLTLEKTGAGKIKFPASYSVNASGQDYGSNVLIGSGFISVNTSALNPSFNSTATLTMDLAGIYSGAAAPAIYYYPGFANSTQAIVQGGSVCVSPHCTGISWNSTGKILTFNVSGFSGYGVNDSGTFGGASNGTTYENTGTLGINITSTNQIAVYTSSSSNNSAFSFIPVTPPAAGSITLASNESSNVTGGDTGFLVENQGNVNVSITVASDKDAASFIGGSAPLFQMFGGVNETGACPSINASMQSLSASAITVCPSLAYADSQDTIWAYVLVKIDSDSPPQTSTATLTFTSTQV